MVNFDPNELIPQNAAVYEFDYYSGSQISIYVGNVLVDDVDAIQFSVSQSKRPVYGYASQYAHRIADGQILVEGSFTIPFKEADYIISVLKNYQNMQPPVREFTKKYNAQGTGPGSFPAWEESEQRVYYVNHASIERYVESRTKISTTTDDDINVLQHLTALEDEAWEDAAETFEDLLWQKQDDKFETPNLHGGKIDDRTRRADQFPLFDIWVLYGDLENPAANHTIKKIVDVSIVGQGQTIVVGGEPVQEVYQFLGRNLV